MRIYSFVKTGIIDNLKANARAWVLIKFLGDEMHHRVRAADYEQLEWLRLHLYAVGMIRMCYLIEEK
jgi:hypothetical protein